MAFPEAKVFTFEPLGDNIFALTSTFKRIKEMPDKKHLFDRVAIFPVGLGDKSSKKVMSSLVTNEGGSWIRNEGSAGERKQDEVVLSLEEVKNADWRVENTKRDVIVKTLDYLFGISDLQTVRFAKIDVEGFECNVFNGMPNTVKKIHALKVEVLMRNLAIQGVCKTRDDILSYMNQSHQFFSCAHEGCLASNAKPIRHIYEDTELYVVFIFR